MQQTLKLTAVLPHDIYHIVRPSRIGIAASVRMGATISHRSCGIHEVASDVLNIVGQLCGHPGLSYGFITVRWSLYIVYFGCRMVAMMLLGFLVVTWRNLLATWSWHQIRQPHIREYEAGESGANFTLVNYRTWFGRSPCGRRDICEHITLQTVEEPYDCNVPRTKDQ